MVVTDVAVVFAASVSTRELQYSFTSNNESVTFIVLFPETPRSLQPEDDHDLHPLRTGQNGEGVKESAGFLTPSLFSKRVVSQLLSGGDSSTPDSGLKPNRGNDGKSSCM